MDTDEIIAARRAALRKWIDDHYEGVQERYRAAAEINQGELSGLLRDKSFGEKRASSLEKQSPGMPEGYLVSPGGAKEAKPDRSTLEGKVRELSGDVLYLRAVIDTVLAAVARSTPAFSEGRSPWSEGDSGQFSRVCCGSD
jgi:hypothetical protein